MKLVQIVPRGKVRLFGAIVKKEADIRKNDRGTFYRVGRATTRATHASTLRRQRTPMEMSKVHYEQECGVEFFGDTKTRPCTD